MNKNSVSEYVLTKKAVMFDLFHTLTALELTCPRGGQKTSEILGVTEDAFFEQLWNRSKERLTGELKDPFTIIKTMAHKINPNIPDEIIQQATKNRINRFKCALLNVPPITIKALQALKIMQKKIALISNADVVEKYGWDKSPIKKYFDVVIFSCDVGYMKPNKEIYEYCLKELNEKPENAIFIGDGGSEELSGAKQVGITTVMIIGIIKNLWPDKIESRKKDADFIIENLDELI